MTPREFITVLAWAGLVKVAKWALSCWQAVTASYQVTGFLVKKQRPSLVIPGQLPPPTFMLPEPGGKHRSGRHAQVARAVLVGSAVLPIRTPNLAHRTTVLIGLALIRIPVSAVRGDTEL